MASDWREVRLGDLVAQGVLEISDGYRVRNEELGPEGIPFVRGGDIGDGWINTNTQDHIRPEFADRVRGKLARPGDVAFITKGTVGRAGRLRAGQPAVVFAPQVAYWRVREREILDSGFLFYLTGSREFQAALDGVKTHGSMVADYVSISQQHDFVFQFPPIDSQRAIARILGALDDRIELNRRMNETLEAMTRALFKSWFVDFDPVRAKAEGRDPGLPRPLADLFPDSFEVSELGEIPRGWRVAPLQHDCVVVKGVSYKGSGLGNEGMPLHNLNSVLEGGGYKYEGIKHYKGEFAERHRVRPGDVVVANTEQGHHRLLIGYAAIVPGTFGNEGIFSHHLYRLRPRVDSALTSEFLCHLLNSPVTHDVVSGYANGTTVNMLPVDGVQKPLIVMPPDALIGTFDVFARHAQARIEEMVVESRMLGKVRDMLLPKLISGEVRVKDAEKLAAGAL